jgi:hypothetical protein
MKTHPNCPKCASKRVLCIPGRVGSLGTGSRILIGRTILGAIPVDRYVCASCGFMEEWIDSSEARERLALRWEAGRDRPRKDRPRKG